MISRPTSPYPHNSFRQIAGGALAAILFLAVLVLAILVSYRYAHGWTQVPSGRAETVLPAASDGLAGAISVLGVLVGMVWLACGNSPAELAADTTAAAMQPPASLVARLSRRFGNSSMMNARLR